MTEALTREQFRVAVADAVAGVINVYREVDTMLRELAGALAKGEPAFSLAKRVVPGAHRKNPDARYLRDYVSNFYVPLDADDDDEDPDEEEEGEGEEEEEDESRKKKVLMLKAGGGIVIATAAVYDRNASAFEPTLLVGALTRCRTEPDAPPGAVFRVPRPRLKNIVRAASAFGGGTGKFQTGAVVTIEGQAKSKAKHKLVFDVPQALQRYPLFDVTPALIETIAQGVRSAWASVPAG